MQTRLTLKNWLKTSPPSFRTSQALVLSSQCVASEMKVFVDVVVKSTYPLSRSLRMSIYYLFQWIYPIVILLSFLDNDFHRYHVAMLL